MDYAWVYVNLFDLVWDLNIIHNKTLCLIVSDCWIIMLVSDE
jgi:hypothetical protein